MVFSALAVPILLFIGGSVHSNRKTFEEDRRKAVDAVVFILIALLAIINIFVGAK